MTVRIDVRCFQIVNNMASRNVAVVYVKKAPLLTAKLVRMADKIPAGTPVIKLNRSG